MKFPQRSTLIEAGCVLALCALIAAVWLTTTNRWSAENWRTPLSYEEESEKIDVLWLLAGMKAAQDGHIGFFQRITIPELGAPLNAHWDDFPWTEKVVFLLPGLLARWVGLFPVLNLSVLFAHLLAGAGFYAAARATKTNRTWALVGAIVFAFSSYAWARGAHHLNVTLFWHVPLCLLVCRWITSTDGLLPRSRRWWVAIAIAVITGMQNIYYTNIFVQLALLGAIMQWIRRGWGYAWPGVAISGVAGGTVALMNMNTFMAWGAEGVNSGAIVRYYQWLEFYALKLSDLFIPTPSHRFLGDFSLNYFKETLIAGELPPGCYMGVVGIVAFVCLAWVTFRRLALRSLAGVPLESIQIGWVLLYSVVGGINGLLGAAGIQLFRATTRYSIVILALVLLFFVRRLSLRLADRPILGAVLALWIVLVALVDQTPVFTTSEKIARVAQATASDKKFVEEIETRLPAGAMIFQLPIIDFPERHENGLSGYEHFRPYLFSKDLRFSFGTVKGRPRQDWHNDLKQLGLNDAIATLERYGFAALMVNLKGFPGKGQEIADSFGQLGRGDGLQSEMKDFICLFLQPAAEPALPERLPPKE